MQDILLTDNRLDPNGYWDKPLDKLLFLPIVSDLALFDQNGYDLTELEKHFADVNCTEIKSHRSHRTAIKHNWFTQPECGTGAHLNHSLLFERKGYTGEARVQLTNWTKQMPLVHKLLAIKPKWGLDFSMDYVDNDGNAFEVLHWEYDGFDYEEVQVRKLEVQAKFATIDWEDAAAQILKHKDEWHHLEFFEQSDWKCNYFGIPKERFKMVAWE
jgi:hypothetical protein